MLQHPLPPRLVLAVPALARVLERERAARRTLQHDLLHRGGQVPPGRVEVELEGARETRQDHFAQVPARLAPGKDHAFENREARVAEDEIGAHFALRAEARALGAGAERRVEGELPRLELGEREPARRAGVALGEERGLGALQDRKSTRLNSSHGYISYAVFCLKKKNKRSL